MKVLKRIGLLVLALVAIVLITALFVKQDMQAEREIVINKPKAEVFDYVKQLKNQNDYSKWATMDPNMQKTYTGTDGTVGFVSAWKSENGQVGSGEQEITAIKNGERIDYDLRFKEPFESKATTYMTTEAVGTNQTKVKWGFNGKMVYPLNFMCLFVDMDKSLGDDFSVGLSRLKSNLERQ